MIVEKAELQKTIRVLSSLDVQACAFIGVQLNDKPDFIRTSPFGFLKTKEFKTGNPHVFASLSNFKDLLSVSSEKMDLTIDKFGKIKLDSESEGISGAKLQVYTARMETTGYKHHFLGNEDQFTYPHNLFSGFDIRAFRNVVSPPILFEGRLMVTTLAGSVIWTGGTELKRVLTQPRESFLRFVAAGVVSGDIYVSNQGYWIAERDDIVCAYTSHRSPVDQIKIYNVQVKDLAHFDASCFVASLENVSSLCSDTDRVDVNPKEGIFCRDHFSNIQVFPHGAQNQNWQAFCVTGKTAKFLADVLRQTKEEIAVLSSVPLRNPTYRLVRGSFEVNFGII